MVQAIEQVTTDAVIVLPGIMGSELRERGSGDQLWGSSEPGWYVRAWRNPATLSRLALDDDERAGRYGRIVATGPLTAPAFAPLLRGIEHYRRLLDRISQAVAAPQALRVFAYDWRLPVDHNARLLADVAARHLDAWRRHGHPEARLVLVGHSMGGLVARYWTDVLGGDELVRTTVTLGTPFAGAIKAVEMLAAGRGVPGFVGERMHAGVRALAVTLPGLYDLLPTRPCVLDAGRLRPLSTADVVTVGGDRDLAKSSSSRLVRENKLRWTDAALRTVVGTAQPTAQSLSIVDGVVRPVTVTLGHGPDGTVVSTDRRGDGTVARDAATPGGTAHTYLAQSHGGLARSAEVAEHVVNVLTEGWLGQPLGLPEPGLDLPDVVPAGQEFTFQVTGVDRAAETNALIGPVGRTGPSRPTLLRAHRRDGGVWVTVPPRPPGIHRIEVGGVSELVMAMDPEDTTV